MNVTINDSFFVDTNINLVEDLKQLIDMINAKIGDIHFYRREKMDFSFLSQNKQFYIEHIVVIGSIQKCSTIGQNRVLNKAEVRPKISSDTLASVLACSMDNDIHHMVTVGDCDLVDTPQFEIGTYDIEQIRSKEELRNRYLCFPKINSIEEVFNRIHEMFPHIIFTGKAYNTCNKKEDVYRKYGYENMIKLFEIANESLFSPLISGNYGSEDALFSDFFDKSKIEISRETPETMRKYGKQREVVLDKNNKVQMTLHLKINDARIYIYPVDGKIYVGHCGKHLQTKKYH